MAEQETRLVLEVGLSEALARRLEQLFEDAPHDAKEEALLLDQAAGEIFAAIENCGAELLRFDRADEAAGREPERDLLQEAVEAWPQFDAPADEEAPVSGADLVEWFGEWRQRAKEILRAKPVPRVEWGGSRLTNRASSPRTRGRLTVMVPLLSVSFRALP